MNHSLSADETAGWIFSQQGHDWMDNDVRGGRGYPEVRNFQVPVVPWSGAPRLGWEYGLFGFKPIEVDECNAKAYTFFAHDMQGQTYYDDSNGHVVVGPDDVILLLQGLWLPVGYPRQEDS